MCPLNHFSENYFQHHVPDDSVSLVINFFVVFSRFEFALKANRFLNGNEEGVSANWDTFANSLHGSFQPNRTEELRTAIDYLHNFPPRKQIARGGTVLGWALRTPAIGQPLINELLLSIRTMRNNLFHGGKFQEVLHEGYDRDRRLLDSAMIVLEECLRLSPAVRSSFFAEIPDMLDVPPGETIHA